jgi:hypothetical protein
VLTPHSLQIFFLLTLGWLGVFVRMSLRLNPKFSTWLWERKACTLLSICLVLSM